MNAAGKWDKVLRSRTGWFDIHPGELWRYRDLIAQFVWRDFVAVYKQTILGPIWYLIQPLLTTVVFTVIFGKVARLPTDNLPPFLFYFAGVVAWRYFADCLTNTSNTFVSNAHIFGKVYFPRLTVPVSVVVSNLVAFGIQLFLFVACYLYFLHSSPLIRPNLPALLLLPLLVVQMAALGLGFGIIVSSLTIRYRDLSHLVGFGVQLWMYVTPVIYPLSFLPERWRWVMLLNPMTPIIEAFRVAFLGTGSISLSDWFISLGSTACILLLGMVLFSRVEKTFMDTV